MGTEFLERRRQSCEFLLGKAVDHSLPNTPHVCRSSSLEKTPALWCHFCIGGAAVIGIPYAFDQTLLQHPLHPPGESTPRQSKTCCEVAQFHSSTRGFRQHCQQLVVATIDTEPFEVGLDVLQHVSRIQYEASPGPKFNRVEPSSHEGTPPHPKLGQVHRRLG